VITEKRFLEVAREVMSEYLPKVPRHERNEFLKALADELAWEGLVEQEGSDIEESDENSEELEF